MCTQTICIWLGIKLLLVAVNHSAIYSPFCLLSADVLHYMTAATSSLYSALLSSYLFSLPLLQSCFSLIHPPLLHCSDPLLLPLIWQLTPNPPVPFPFTSLLLLLLSLVSILTSHLFPLYCILPAPFLLFNFILHTTPTTDTTRCTHVPFKSSCDMNSIWSSTIKSYSLSFSFCFAAKAALTTLSSHWSWEGMWIICCEVWMSLRTKRCMYVCMYVCMYTCIYIHRYVWSYSCMYVCMYDRMMCVFMHAMHHAAQWSQRVRVNSALQYMIRSDSYQN